MAAKKAVADPDEFDLSGLDAPEEGMKPAAVPPMGLLPEDAEIEEFTIEDIEEAKELANMTFLTLAAAFAHRHNGGDFSYVQKPLTTWTLQELVLFGTVLSPISHKYARKGEMGRFNQADYLKASNYSEFALKYSLRSEAAPVLMCFTDRTILHLMFAHKGITIKTGVPERGVSTAEITIPGYSGGDREPITVGLCGEHCGRVLTGGLMYVNWYNVEYNARINYRTIDPTVVQLAAIFHQRVQLVSINNGQSITAKDRKLPPPKVKNLSVLVEAATFIKRATNHIIAAYDKPKWRPSWSPTGKNELDVVEWLLDQHYSDAYGPGEMAQGAKDLVSLLQKSIHKMWKEMKIAAGDVCAGDLKLAYTSLIRGDLKAPATGAAVTTFKAVSDIVELSRNQERSHDFVTKKRDVPGIARPGGAHTSVPFKIHNAVKQMEWIFGKTKSPVHAIGVGDKSHWLAEMRELFPDSPVFWYDKVAAYHPLEVKDFAIKDVLDPMHVPPGSGEGNVLISDVFPGANIKELRYSIMMSNLLNAGYERGIIKLYLGSDLEATTPVNGKTPPPFITEWATKYKVISFAQGGGSHGQEYFLIFGGRVRQKGEWIPPTSVRAKPPVFDLAAQETPPLERVALVQKFAAQWLAIKALDMIRLNYWKAPYAYNGIYGNAPDWVDGGAFINHLFFPENTILHLRGKGIEMGAMKESTLAAPPREMDDSLFSGL